MVGHLEHVIGFRYIARDIAKIARDSKTPNMDMREYLDGISGQIAHLEKIQDNIKREGEIRSEKMV